MRSTTVNKKKYGQLLKDLRQIAGYCGFTVQIRKREVIYKRHGEERPNFGEMYGYCDPVKRKLTVVYFGNTGRAKILWVLAHEVRHAIHVSTNMFKDYYDIRHREAINTLNKTGLLPEGYRPPDLGIAVRAERDCDNWAFKFLKEKDIEFRPKNRGKYDKNQTYVYHLWFTYKMANLK
jgi:hypothetical protein